MSQRVSAVLLAAGLSKRMGLPKQLLPLKGKPIIRHCLDALLSAGLDDIVVVLNRRNNGVVTAVKELPVRIVFNMSPDSDMSESVRTGLRMVRRSSTGVMVSLGDQPLITAATIKTLAASNTDNPGRIHIPQYKKRRGHPVVLPKALLEDIFNVGTLRDIIKQNSDKVCLVPVPDEGVIIDIDTMDDYRKVRQAGLTEAC